MTKEQLRKIGVVAISIALVLTALASLLALVYPIIPRQFEEIHTTNLPMGYYDNDPNGLNKKTKPFNYAGQTLEHKDSPAETDIPAVSTRINSCYSPLSQACNMKLLEICEEYFAVSYNGERVSPLLIMAMCQNETGLRCDSDITFCALYPSAVVPLTSVEEIEAFDTTKVIESANNFSKLAADWWTRDRGPLQMNPFYGVRNDKFNAQLGISEYDKLKDIPINQEYSAYTDKEGVITSTHWISEATKKGGDRHCIKDVCLRMSSEFTYSVSLIQNSYEVRDDSQLACMLSMHHGSGSLWLPEFKESKVGYWKSGDLACEYARNLSRQEVYDQIYALAKKKVVDARTHSYNPDVGLSTAEAVKLYNQFVEQGWIRPMDEYTAAGNYRDAYITYPLKTLFNMSMLQILYNGG